MKINGILIKKRSKKNFKKTLTEQLSLNDEAEMPFSWEKNKVYLIFSTSYPTDKKDVERINKIIKKNTMKIQR